MSTKQCPGCGSPYVNPMWGESTKKCETCKLEFAWPLDSDQKPVFGDNRAKRKSAKLGEDQ